MFPVTKIWERKEKEIAKVHLVVFNWGSHLDYGLDLAINITFTE